MLMLGIYDGPAGGMLLDATPYLVENVALGNDKHGYESLSATVERRLVGAFRMYARTAIMWAKLWWAGQIVWEGRVEDPSVWARAGSGLRFVAFGAWRALSDLPYTALWSTTAVSAWRAGTEIDLSTLRTERYQVDTNNRLYLAISKGETYATGIDFGMLLYQIPDQSSRPIIGVSFDYRINLPVGWTADFAVSDAGFTSYVTVFTHAGTGGTVTGAFHAVFGGRSVMSLLIYNNSGAPFTATLETGVNFAQLTNVRLVSSTTNRVNTTHTVARGAGVNVTATVGSTANMYVGQRLGIGATGVTIGESVIVKQILSSTQFVADFTAAAAVGLAVQAHVIYADEVLKDMVSVVNAANPNQLNSSTAAIQSPSLDLFDEIYTDQGMAAIIDRLAGFGDNQTPARQWEACVLGGQQLIFRPRGSAARAWFADVSSLQAERSLANYANSAYGVYADASNRTLRTAVAANSTAVTASGLTRRQAVSASTTSSVQAGVQRDAYLNDHDDLSARSTIAFDRLFDAGGANHKLWDALAGDSLTIRNLPPASGAAVDQVRTITIGRASLDVTSRTLTIEPDPPPPQLASLLARLAAGLPPS